MRRVLPVGGSEPTDGEASLELRSRPGGAGGPDRDWRSTPEATAAVQEGSPREAPGGPPGSGAGGRLTPEAVVTFLVVGACVAFVFWQLEPSQMFRDTTPAGGDMGAHVWLPAYLERVLIPHGQIFGWSMDWYAGFPVPSFYFPLPMYAIALAGYVIPYDIAFKLVTASGLIALPVACWAFGRLARIRFPGPACLAVASVPFLFGREFTIYGGNIASTMAGEFSFAISLSLAIVFCGLVARGLRTGRGRILAAVVLAACGLSHVLPLFFAIVGSLVLLALEHSVRRLVWLATVGIVGGLLVAFWAVPFVYRLPYATNMGYGKITAYIHTLFPQGELWLYLLAAVGATLAFTRSNLIGKWLAYMAGLSALAFVLAPNGRLWNARALPFWFLTLYLLAGIAFSEVGTALIEALLARRERSGRAAGDADREAGANGWGAGSDARAGRSLLPASPSRLVVVPVLTLLVALVWVGYPLRILPGGTVTANGDYRWAGITSSDNSFVPDWVRWNYSGYQARDKSSRTAYFAIMRTMRRIGATDGCGRSMYEYEPAINDMGTPDALMLLPYWTHGCISTMEGLYYEASATTPYHFLDAAELSAQPSNPMRGLDYPSAPDVTLGVEHLQMLGVKYFLAVSPTVQAQAAADPSLRLLASVGPYPTDVTSGSRTTVQQQTWKVYRVLDSPLVSPLRYQPAVVPDTLKTATTWLHLSESWYLDPARWRVYLAAAGPRSWARVSAGDPTPPLRREPSSRVSAVHLHEESVSFDVSRTGVPVLVKVSYFPNWHVQGASGVYRVTPNLMVVVPTAHHVELTYGSTPIDWVGTGLSVLGLVALLLMWRFPVRRWVAPDGTIVEDRPPRLSSRRGRRRPLLHGPPEDPEFWGGAPRTRPPPPGGGEGSTPPFAQLPVPPLAPSEDGPGSPG